MSPNNLLALILIIAWILRTKKSIFFQVYLWQLKEYRWDRFRDFLGTRQSNFLLFSYVNLARFLGLVLYAVVYYADKFWGSLIWYILFVFVLEIFLALWEIKERGLLRPKLTAKALLILALTSLIHLLTLGLIYFNAGTLYNLALGLLALAILSPVVTGLVILVLKPVTYAAKKAIIKKAQRKMAQFKNLKVIGITGSYGKSSTKEFLYTILNEKYKVLKTPEHVNTDIGVAKTILNDLDETHEVFIVEMGAYRPGEIKVICDLVKPQIGIITGISKQHLGLFGSLENILHTKFELADSLPPTGTLFVNGDCAYCLYQQNEFKGEQIFYSTRERGDLSARDIKVEKDRLVFRIVSAGQAEASALYSVNLLGAYNISNLLPCIGVAQKLAMNFSEIIHGLAKIKPLVGTMKLYKGLNNVQVIDDSYNANPDGVKLALEHLRLFEPAKKIIVFSQLLELGNEAAQIHKEVGARLAEIGDKIIIVSENYWPELEDGFKSKEESGLYYFIREPEKVIAELKRNSNSDTVILLEGRMPEIILKSLLPNA